MRANYLLLVFLLAGLVHAAFCLDFQSRHLLEEPKVLAEAESSVVGVGSGAGSSSLNIGSHASTGALSGVDPLTGVLTEAAMATTGGEVEVEADETSTDSASNADSIVVSEGRGPTQADGMVAVMSEADAEGEHFAITGADAEVVLQEGPVVSDEDAMVIGSFATADGSGAANGAAGGDSLADSSVHGELDLDARERYVDLDDFENAMMGYFGNAVVEVALDGQADGLSESEDSLSSSASELDLGAETSVIAAPGVAAADVSGHVAGGNAGLGEVIATNGVVLSGSILSDATDNTLRPDLGFAKVNAEDAEGITQAAVTSEALSEGTEDFITESGGSLNVVSGAVGETKVEGLVLPGFEQQFGDAAATAYAGGMTAAYAIGSSIEDNQFSTYVNGYTRASTEVQQDASGESYAETLGRNFVEAASEGEGGIFVQGGALADGGSMAEGSAGFINIPGLAEEQVVAYSGLAGGYADAYAEADDTTTSTFLKSRANGDAINLNYQDGVTGYGGFADTKGKLEIGALGEGEDFSSSVTGAYVSASAQMAGITDSLGFKNQLDTISAVNTMARATGDETLVEGSASLSGETTMSANTFGVNAVDFIEAGGVAATGTGVEYDVDGDSIVAGTGESALGLIGGADSTTITAIREDAVLESEGAAELLLLVDASGDDIYTTGELDLVTGSGGAGGFGYLGSDATNTGFGAEVSTAVAGGLVDLGGYDASEDESNFLLSGSSEAGTEIELDNESGAFAYTNQDAVAAGATMVEGLVAAETMLGTTSGGLSLSEGLYEKYAVGLGVAENSLYGMAVANGVTTGAPGTASLLAEAGSIGLAETVVQTAADDLTFDASEAYAAGYGALEAHAAIDTTGYNTDVQTSSLSTGALGGLVGSGVDGSKGSMSVFESDTLTEVSATGVGPNANAASGTSALLHGNAVSYTDPAGVGVGTVIRDVDASGTGYADASPNGVVAGYTESDSTSEVLDREDCQRGEDCFTVEGGFAAAAAIEGGFADAGSVTIPGTTWPYVDVVDFRGYLAAGVEGVASAFTAGFAAALDVQGNEVDGAIAGGLGLGAVLIDAEADIYPDGLMYTGEAKAEAEEAETFSLELGDGEAHSFSYGEIDYDNAAMIVTGESVFVEADALGEAGTVVLAEAEDYAIEVATEAMGYSAGEAFASNDELYRSKVEEFTPNSIFYFSALGAGNP